MDTMDTKAGHGDTVARRERVLRAFDYLARRTRATLRRHFGERTAAVERESRDELASILPGLPDVGPVAQNPMAIELIGSAIALAQYRTYVRHGKSVEEAGTIVYEQVYESYRACPAFVRWLVRRGHYGRFVLGRLRRLAARSQERRHPGDWVFTFVEGDGERFDWGLDFTECAISKFYEAEGAKRFMPALCSLDFALGRAFENGFARTTTIAEGAARCDFRYRKGRPVERGWP